MRSLFCDPKTVAAAATLAAGFLGCSTILGIEYPPLRGSDAAAGADGAPDVTVDAPSTCIDTQSDSRHCGRCNHSCLGDPCRKGVCQPTALATGQEGGYGIDVDADNVYWSTASASTASGALFKIGKSSTVETPFKLADRANRFRPLDVRVDVSGDFVGTVNNQSGNGFAAAFRVSTDGLQEIELAVSCSSDGARGLAIDESFFYFVNGAIGAVQRVGKNEGPCTTIATDQPHPAAVAVDGDTVFFVNELAAPGEGGLMKLLKAGGTPTPVTDRIVAGRGLVIQGTTIFVSTTDNKVVRVEKDGSGFAELAIDTAEPRGLAVDETTVYWAASGQVFAADKVTGGKRLLADNQPNVAVVAVDGARLYWATDKTVMRLAK